MDDPNHNRRRALNLVPHNAYNHLNEAHIQAQRLAENRLLRRFRDRGNILYNRGGTTFLILMVSEFRTRLLTVPLNAQIDDAAINTLGFNLNDALALNPLNILMHRNHPVGFPSIISSKQYFSMFL